jgi:hypothetical protein
VVVAILALLSGIIYTAFAPAREKARQVACAGNLRQIHHALMLYCQDYGGGEPDGPQTAAGLGLPPILAWGRYGNGGALTERYVKDPRLWLCPNDDCLRHGEYFPECRADPRKCCNSYTLPRVNMLDCQENVPGCFPPVVARCGDRLPLMSCRFHGFDQGVSTFRLVLRWNGQVEGRYIQQPDTPCLD